MRLPLLKEIVEKVIKELIVHGDRDDADHFVTHREDLWIFPENEFPQDMKLKLNLASDDFEELMDEERQDIIFGSIHGDSLYVYQVGPFIRDPRSSVIIKKIVNQLNLSSVRYPVIDHEVQVDRDEILGKIPEVAYHGTSSEYLSKILKLGLKPGETYTNYPLLATTEPGFSELMRNTVYFSTRFDEAEHHATYTTDKLNATNEPSDPVVIALRIPDKDKLVTDFDVEKQIARGDKGSKPFSATKEVGVYGYRGRVPASFFVKFYVAMNTEPGDIHSLVKEDFVELDLAEVKRYIESKDELGYGDPNYDPEDYYEEE